MANRLPVPGSDNGQWGQILNDYLSVEHSADGTLKRLGVNSGVAQLDSGGKLTTAQVPTNVALKSTNANDVGKAIDAYTGDPLPIKLQSDVLLSEYLGKPAYPEAFDAMQAAIVAAQGSTSKRLVLDTLGVISLTKADGGGLKIAAGKPLTIVGPGEQNLTIRLSRGVPRLFDLDPLGIQDQTFRAIHISGFTVDANNVDGTAMAPATTITSNTTIAGSFAWTTLQLTSNANFQGSTDRVWFMPSNAGTAKSIAMSARPVAGSSTNIEVQTSASVNVVAGDQITGALTADHCIIGNRRGAKYQQANSGGAIRTSFDDISVEHIKCINLPATQVVGLGTPTPSQRYGFCILMAGAGSSATNITFKEVHIFGGDCGFYVHGLAGTWIDDIVFEDWTHDRGSVPTANYSSSNILVGQDSYIGRVQLRGTGTGLNSGDVGVEVDQAMICEIGAGTLIQDAFSACYYVTNFVSPARSIAGPPTSTITNAGGIDASVTTVTLASVPSGIDHEGFCVIGTEVCHYQVNIGYTTLRIERGNNGSTAAIHAQGDLVTFHENARQRYTFRGQSRRINSTSGKGFAAYANKFLPFPDMSFPEGGHERNNDTGEHGEAMYIDGHIGRLTIGRDYRVSVAGNISQASSLMYFNRPGATAAAGILRVPPAIIKFAGPELRVSGKSTGASFVFIKGGAGYFDIECPETVRIFNGLTGLSPTTTFGFQWGSAACTVRASIDLKVFSGDQVDAAMQPVNFAGSTSLTRLDLELDLFQMNGGTAGTTSYFPWTTNDPTVVHVHRIVHPFSQGGNYPRRPRKWHNAINASYSALGSDEVIPVDTSTASGTVTITLPIISGGNSSTNPSPGSGIEVVVLDVGANANVRNIVATANAADKMQGTLGGSYTINTAGGKVRLGGHGSLGWWPL